MQSLNVDVQNGRVSDSASAEAAEGTPWARPPEDALEEQGSTKDGLSDEEARERLERYGPNSLPGEEGVSKIKLALKQFQSPLIYILLLAGLVSLVLDHLVDAAVILAVLLFNAAIGYYQEYRAEQSIRALQKLARSQARVIRNGKQRTIEAEELVPGDVVSVRGGDRVPADCRIVEEHGLDVDESVLTGESAPVHKNLEAVEESTLLPDRTSMVHTGTVVTRGQAKALVVATGSSTELGRIAGSVRDVEDVQTPLQWRMSRLANLIALAVLVLGAGIVGLGYLLGDDLEELFFTVITLAVSAIPEGLPVVLTVALAVGVNRMASRNAIIRRLPAVETLGSCTVIGSDKTGTLTQNRMTVQEVWSGGKLYEVEGSGYGVEGEIRLDGEVVDPEGEEHQALRMTLLGGALANEADISREDDEFRPDGDPTEVALLISAEWAGISLEESRKEYEQWGEIPFESEKQYSASFNVMDGRDVAFVKGSPEAVLEMCTSTYGGDKLDRDEVLQTAQEMAGRGLRVLAMACAEVDREKNQPEPQEPEDLSLMGLQGMMDPPRDEAKEAVRDCQSAGIRVVMITGDHAGTARAIAADLGIARSDGGDEEVIEGAQLAETADEDLPEMVAKATVFARVSPHDKLRIVQALQKQGEAVAVTGDGVNDAPALKAADIGIAMGQSGTDVAKEASDMIIADDNFASIRAAVEEGRFSFDNVRKATFFLVSSGVAEVIAVVTSIIFGFPAPFRPVQILWLNLVTNGVQDVALAFEPGEQRLMEEPPRPRSEGVLSRLLYERTLIAGIWMAAATLLLFLLEREAGASLEKARTIALTTMVMFQVFHAQNSRSEYTSIFGKTPWSNLFLLLGSVGAVAIHALAIYWGPLQSVLELEALNAMDLLVMAAVAVTILPVMELHKLMRRRPERPVETAPTAA